MLCFVCVMRVWYMVCGYVCHRNRVRKRRHCKSLLIILEERNFKSGRLGRAKLDFG